jgi:hypothetical protein
MHMERKKGRDEDERIGRDNTDKHVDEDERTQRMMTREEVHMIMMYEWVLQRGEDNDVACKRNFPKFIFHTL